MRSTTMLTLYYLFDTVGIDSVRLFAFIKETVLYNKL